jgi:chorismate mutase
MEAIRILRRRIDRLDDQILRLLARRAALAVQVGLIKRRTGLSARSSDRERAILHRIARSNQGPLQQGAVRRIFRSIVQESRRAAIRELRK